MEDRFVARTSRARVWLLLLGSILLMLGSLWMAGAFGAPPSPDRVWMGWVGAPLFALLGAMWATRLRAPADQIVIDEEGLTCRSWSDEHIPWSAIERIDEFGIHRQTFSESISPIRARIRRPAFSASSPPPSRGWAGAISPSSPTAPTSGRTTCARR